MATWIAAIYDVGLFVAVFAYGARVGFGTVGANWREFLRANPGFFMVLAGKTVVWPIILVIWIITGMQPPRRRAIVELDGHPVRLIISNQSVTQLQKEGRL